MKKIVVARIGWAAGVVLHLAAWLLWSAVALRLPVDGAVLGLVWFGVPFATTAAFVRYWNRNQAGRVEVVSWNTFGRHDLDRPDGR